MTIRTRDMEQVRGCPWHLFWKGVLILQNKHWAGSQSHVINLNVTIESPKFEHGVEMRRTFLKWFCANCFRSFIFWLFKYNQESNRIKYCPCTLKIFKKDQKTARTRERLIPLEFRATQSVARNQFQAWTLQTDVLGEEGVDADEKKTCTTELV